MKMTRDEKIAIVLQIFDDYKYMGGLRVLKAAAPNLPEVVVLDFVEEAFNELVSRIEEGWI